MAIARALGRHASRRRFFHTKGCPGYTRVGQIRGYKLGRGVYGVKDQTVEISKQRFEELLVAEATQLAQVRQTSVSIELMRKFGTNPTLDTLLKSARFLYRELPVRYAIRAKEFELAPSWIKAKPFKQISDMYMQCFLDLRSAEEPSSARAEEQLCEVLSRHKERLALVISLLAEGATELKTKRGLTPGEEEYLQDILDRFLTARIGTSVLTSQHLALHEDVVDGRKDGYVGALQLDCSPDRVFRDAAESVRLMCQRELGQAPGFVVKGHLDVKFPYFPAHIHYIGCELLKNSFRATIEHSVQFRNEPNFSIPNVEIVIGSSSEDEDVCIMIRDRGGGIPSSAQKDVWKYTHTTWHSPGEEETHYARRDGILAGKGFGLPLARLYARFFGGDLELCSLAGIGTAAYVRLKRLGGVEQVGKYHQDRLHAAFPQTFTPRYPFGRD